MSEAETPSLRRYRKETEMSETMFPTRVVVTQGNVADCQWQGKHGTVKYVIVELDDGQKFQFRPGGLEAE